MRYTENYNLKLPEGSDYVLVEDLNDVTTKLDEEMKALHDVAFDFDNLALTLGANVTIAQNNNTCTETMTKDGKTIATRTTVMNTSGTITQTVIAEDYSLARRIRHSKTSTGYKSEVIE